MKGAAALLVAGVLLVACDAAAPATDSPPHTQLNSAVARPTLPALPDLFDCLRESGAGITSAHRGGPAPGLPENALETLQAGYDDGLRLFEVDIAASADGTLFLHHDDRLERTTTGRGLAAATPWRDIAALRLRDNDGRVTGYRPTLLADALNWAVSQGAILKLDRKRGVDWDDLAVAINRAGAVDHVVLITYSLDAARRALAAAPGLMLSVPLERASDIAALELAGAEPGQLLAWTGTRPAARAQLQRLRAAGIEPILGTLGRPGRRLDDRWLADGDGREYADAVDAGVVILASDTPRQGEAALRNAGRDARACLTAR